MTSEEHYHEARKRVTKKKKFYKHLSIYVTLSVFFFVLNMLTSPRTWWFYWPMLGWGIGIVSQYFSTFGLPGTGAGSSEWEDREITKEMERLESKKDRVLDRMDEHLELKEIDPRKEKVKTYREGDFV